MRSWVRTFQPPTTWPVALEMAQATSALPRNHAASVCWGKRQEAGIAAGFSTGTSLPPAVMLRPSRTIVCSGAMKACS